eukprot:ANDGO_06580.mRNA.1 G2/mitotic-specific cyclin-B
MYSQRPASLHAAQPSNDENRSNTSNVLGAKVFGAAVAGVTSNTTGYVLGQQRTVLGDRTNRMMTSSSLSSRVPASTPSASDLSINLAPTSASQPNQTAYIPRMVPEGTTQSPQMDRRGGLTHDVMYVSELTDDVYAYLREMEIREMPDPGYMVRQTEISKNMRSILVDWLIDVHNKFRLSPETFFLAVSILDRYLAVKPIARAKLQLAGMTAMLLASKFEEVYPPEVRDFEYISAKAYSKAEILKMERHMLATIRFKMSVPTPFSFLDRFCRAANMDARQKKMASFLLELSQQEYSLCRFPASVLTAASVGLAKKYMPVEGADEKWTASLVHYTRYTEDVIMPAMREIHEAMKALGTSKLEGLKKKYCSPKFLEVAPIAASRCNVVSF